MKEKMTEEIMMEGIDKLRDAGYYAYENGEFIDAPHDWLNSDTGKRRFCIVCGLRQKYDIFKHKWVDDGEVIIMEAEI